MTRNGRPERIQGSGLSDIIIALPLRKYWNFKWYTLLDLFRWKNTEGVRDIDQGDQYGLIEGRGRSSAGKPEIGVVRDYGLSNDYSIRPASRPWIDQIPDSNS